MMKHYLLRLLQWKHSPHQLLAQAQIWHLLVKVVLLSLQSRWLLRPRYLVLDGRLECGVVWNYCVILEHSVDADVLSECSAYDRLPYLKAGYVRLVAEWDIGSAHSSETKDLPRPYWVKTSEGQV